MKRDIQKLSNEVYDVLVIGGGINGAAIAHIAGMQGLKTALIERNDFASGTSSKSTKLIHGGLRYLENLEFGLVRESLVERFIQLKAAPHLVRPLSFVVPVYEGDPRPLWMIKGGIWLYDALSGGCRLRKHRALSAAELLDEVPGVKRRGLRGGVMYMDAQMNDARLCLENVLSAVALGADAANYVEARGLIKENGRTVGVVARDRLIGKPLEIRARRTVCAVGPWTNEFLRKDFSLAPEWVRMTKGVHLVCEGWVCDLAVLVPVPNDRRVFFIIPWMGNTLIGTTDTDFTGNPDDVAVDPKEIDDLLTAARRVFPDGPFEQKNIITSFAGLRPLVSDRGAPDRVSRRHALRESGSGVVYVMGGKYTTYRRIAEDAVGKVMGRPMKNTKDTFSVYGSGVFKETASALAQRWGVDSEVALNLMDFYGIRAEDVLALTREDAGLKERLCSCSPVIRAQIVYAVQTEMAQTEEDIFMRRLVLGYQRCSSGACRAAIRDIVARAQTSS